MTQVWAPAPRDEDGRRAGPGHRDGRVPERLVAVLVGAHLVALDAVRGECLHHGAHGPQPPALASLRVSHSSSRPCSFRWNAIGCTGVAVHREHHLEPGGAHIVLSTWDANVVSGSATLRLRDTGLRAGRGVGRRCGGRRG